MVELTTTRHNPLVDPMLNVWGWEIAVYLFAGGIVAGMLILAGLAMLRAARGDDPKSYFSMHTPLLAFVVINVGMLALFLDLGHKLQVWRVFVTFQPVSPMSWGSWVLIAVYGLLLVSASIRLHEAWPWLGARWPALQSWSDALLGRPRLLRALAWASIALGIALGIYTGILLNTMVARPLWNSAILGPLFLFSGLSTATAAVHLANRVRGRGAPSPGMVKGALSALCQPLGAELPQPRAADALIRFDMGLLAIELTLLALLVLNLYTSSASHAAAAALLVSGPYAWAFWGVIVVSGVLLPLALQGLELGRRIPHSMAPALLVLVGGLALRWVLVDAGQVSHVLQHAGF